MKNITSYRTVRDLVRYGHTLFEQSGIALGQGTQTNFDESCFIVLRTLSLPLDSLEIYLDTNLSEDEINEVIENIKKRAHDRIPAAYILKESWLRDYKFHVDENVLIPRSHIADILFDQIDVWVPDPENVSRVLDLCTGSGCLAILAAHQFTNATVTASDISESCLNVSKINIERYELKNTIDTIQSNLFDQISETFDVIISNPPYVDQTTMNALPTEFQKEPQIELSGGNDGIDLIIKILQNAAKHLTNEGILILEIGRDRKALEAYFPNMSFTWIETQAGQDFVFFLTREELLRGLDN